MVGEKPERERGGASNLEYTTKKIFIEEEQQHVRKGEVVFRVLNIQLL